MLQSRLCLIAGEMFSAPKGWKKLHRTSNLWFTLAFAGNVSYTHCKDHGLPFSLLPTGLFCFPALQDLGRWEGAEEVSLADLFWSRLQLLAMPTLSHYESWDVSWDPSGRIRCIRHGISELAHPDVAHPCPSSQAARYKESLQKITMMLDT